MKKDIERRFIPRAQGEVRAEKRSDGKIGIVGVAAVVESLSEEMWGFREKIAAGAFDKALALSDVRGLFNHDPNMILGRVKSGTMKVWVEGGLRYEIEELPASRADVAEAIQRGDVDGNSFSFTVAEDVWEYKADGSAIRTITEIGELYDVGPVTYPAYPATKVSARAMEMAKHEEKPEPEGKPEAPNYSAEQQKLLLAAAE
jgi:HK97 family phage prohead protease